MYALITETSYFTDRDSTTASSLNNYFRTSQDDHVETTFIALDSNHDKLNLCSIWFNAKTLSILNCRVAWPVG